MCISRLTSECKTFCIKTKAKFSKASSLCVSTTSTWLQSKLYFPGSQSGNGNIKVYNHLDNNVPSSAACYSRVTNCDFGALCQYFPNEWPLCCGWAHACVWACSILLCPGFSSCSSSCFSGPVLLTPETSRGRRRFGNKWLSSCWIKYKERYPHLSLPIYLSFFIYLSICVAFVWMQVWV